MPGYGPSPKATLYGMLIGDLLQILSAARSRG
jgi:hypothetical protein